MTPTRFAEVCGPGAPFEMIEEEVLGTRLPVFAQREPHLRSAMLQAAESFGRRPYLVFPYDEVSFTDLPQRVASVASVLSERFGVERGHRVAFAGANHMAYALAAWASLCLGATVVGLNGWWAKEELEHGISITNPTVVFADTDRRERLHGVGHAPVLSFDELLLEAAARASAEVPSNPLHEDDPALLLFTSGTTGRPRAAVLSHRSLLMYGQAFALSRLAVSAPAPPSPAAAPGPPSMICGSPFFHISGAGQLFAVGPRGGTTLAFPPSGRFDPGVHLEMTERHKVTSWGGVPTQLWRLLEHPDFERHDLSSVVSVSVGGSGVPHDLIRLLEKRLPGVRLSVGYAMTECPAGTVSLSGEALTRRGCVGSPLPGIAVQIRDERGEVLPEGEIGEIHLRAALSLLEYWGDPDATGRALTSDRWYRTGDYGRIEEGLLHLESRMRDLIIRGGENIYPGEVEHRLLLHPDVEDAAVIGVPHRTLGQEVKAFIVPRPGAKVIEADVQAWVADALASFKVPARIELRASLPYTETGKLLKRQLEDDNESTQVEDSSRT